MLKDFLFDSFGIINFLMLSSAFLSNDWPVHDKIVNTFSIGHFFVDVTRNILLLKSIDSQISLESNYCNCLVTLDKIAAVLGILQIQGFFSTLSFSSTTSKLTTTVLMI